MKCELFEYSDEVNADCSGQIDLREELDSSNGALGAIPKPNALISFSSLHLSKTFILPPFVMCYK